MRLVKLHIFLLLLLGWIFQSGSEAVCFCRDSVPVLLRPSATLNKGGPTATEGGGVGGLLYVKRWVSGAWVRKYDLENNRGDVTTQTDASGNVTWQAAYEAFGMRTAEAGTNADPQRGNTKDEDPTGLSNQGHRYLELETGVWLSRDPAGFVDGPNVYCYVRQNPWSSFDPLGLWNTRLQRIVDKKSGDFQWRRGENGTPEILNHSWDGGWSGGAFNWNYTGERWVEAEQITLKTYFHTSEGQWEINGRDKDGHRDNFGAAMKHAMTDAEGGVRNGAILGGIVAAPVVLVAAGTAATSIATWVVGNIPTATTVGAEVLYVAGGGPPSPTTPASEVGSALSALASTERVVVQEIKAAEKVAEKIAAKTADDLFAFGGRGAPRAPRPVQDFGVEPGSLVGPQAPPLPKGASTFGDVTQAPLTGHYHKLPAGTELPPGMGVVADGPSVVPNSPHPPTHHTIYPTTPVTVEDFAEQFLKLPWQYGGKK